MKKAFCLVLAGALLVTSASVFGGCDFSGYTDGPNGDGGGNGGIPHQGVNWDVDLSKPIELNALFPDSGMKSFGKDDTAQIIERETGYKVNYEELSSGNIEGDVGNALMNEEPYHFMKLNDGCYTPYLENGTFLDLTELLTETPEGKVLYQLIDLMDNGWEAVTYTDSNGNKHIYAIPDFGYIPMNDTALVWNVNHLEQIGFEKQFHHALPETLSEVDWALQALQDKFGTNKSYHALAVPGAASAELEQIAGCFEVPYEFYLDENGKIQRKEFSQNMTDYVLYMNNLRRRSILSDGWNTSSASVSAQLFAEELHSVVYVTYWNVTALVNAIQAKQQIAQKMGISNDYQTIHDKAIAWTLRIRGDGFTFNDPNGNPISCKTQDKAMLRGDPGGVSYYTVIPYYMRENARYVIDYLGKKMEAFAKFFGGDEGVHWNIVDAPAGAPAAEDYTEENDAEYTKYENFSESICFVRPYSYTFTDYRKSEEGEEVTVSEPGKWIQLTQRYKDFISNNSQYCTGTNAVTAKIYCHLHELGFDAWYYCDNFPDESSYIHNPMYMAPFMKKWSQVNILARSWLLTGIEGAIGTVDGNPLDTLDFYRNGCRQKYVSKSGEKFYYWADDVSDEMTAWYNASHQN